MAKNNLRYILSLAVIAVACCFCNGGNAQRDEWLKAQTLVRLPSSVRNLSVVDGRLYCYSGGLLLSATMTAGTISSLAADAEYYQYDSDIDYVTKNPHTGHVFFTTVGSKGKHKLYEVIPREGRSPKIRRVRIDGVSSVDHPTFSRDGKVMLFSSPEGDYGGFDIYYSRLMDDESWTDALTMGASVNSSGNEMSPSVCGDYMFYSSLDTSYSHARRLCASLIYGSSASVESPSIGVGNNPTFDLPLPFNSEADDIEIAFDTVAGRIFIASERDGEPQIYVYDGSMPVVVVSGRVTDITDAEASNVDVSLFDNGSLLCRTKTNSEGRYLMVAPQNRSLTLWMSKPGNFGSSKEISTAPRDVYHAIPELVFDARLDRLEMGKAFYIYDVFGGDASIDISQQGRQSLQRMIRFLSENPQIKASIGVTSSMSNDQYFNDLVTSQRVKNLQQYLGEQLPNSKVEVYVEGNSYTGNAQGAFSSRLKVQLD